MGLSYRGGTGPLRLFIDSDGIQAEREGGWNARKHGSSKRRIWRRTDIGIDEETLEARAVDLTAGDLAPLGRSLCNKVRARLPMPANYRSEFKLLILHGIRAAKPMESNFKGYIAIQISKGVRGEQ